MAARLAALTKTPPPAVDSNALGQQRIYTLPLFTKTQLSGDYYLLLSPGKVEGASFIQGAPELKGLEAKLAGALQPVLFAKDKPALFPAGSTARVIRRGVLSCSPLLKNCMLALVLPQDVRRPVEPQQAAAAASSERSEPATP